MKRGVAEPLRPVGLAMFVLLLWPGFAVEGCAQVTFPTMSPGYSTYTTYTTDGTYIYTTVQVSGVINGICPTQPAYLANECHATTHSPQAYNQVGSVGGWEYGGATAWNSWLSITNNQQIAATPGTEYTFTYSTEVVCSYLGGAVYSASGGGISLAIAVTNYIHNGNEGSECIYDLYCPNGNTEATCPAGNPVYVDSTQNQCLNYLHDYRLKVTIFGTVTCFPVGKAELANYAVNCS